jgi:uncharacterized PurR-regulated membrane protein YhhQ (DUF165 family)
MINEVYGRKKTHLAIFIAFITQVLLVTFIAMVNTLSPAPFFKFEEAWQNLFGLSIRITACKLDSFLNLLKFGCVSIRWIEAKILG